MLQKKIKDLRKIVDYNLTSSDESQIRSIDKSLRQNQKTREKYYSKQIEKIKTDEKSTDISRLLNVLCDQNTTLIQEIKDIRTLIMNKNFCDSEKMLALINSLLTHNKLIVRNNEKKRKIPTIKSMSNEFRLTANPPIWGFQK